LRQRNTRRFQTLLLYRETSAAARRSTSSERKTTLPPPMSLRLSDAPLGQRKPNTISRVDALSQKGAARQCRLSLRERTKKGAARHCRAASQTPLRQRNPRRSQMLLRCRETSAAARRSTSSERKTTLRLPRAIWTLGRRLARCSQTIPCASARHQSWVGSVGD